MEQCGGSDTVTSLLGQLQWIIQDACFVSAGTQLQALLAIMERWDGSDTVTSLLGQLQWIIQIAGFMYFSCIACCWTVYLVWPAAKTVVGVSLDDDT